MRKILEKDVLRVVLHYLTIRKVWHRRINSGAAVVEPGSPGTKRRFLRFGAPGMPDILARTESGTVIWIECKSPTGKLSEDQRKWKEDMDRFGDIYIVARRLEDVMCLFEGGKHV